MAQGAVGGKCQSLVGVTDIENIRLGITHAILDLKIHSHQVFILGQHLAGRLGGTDAGNPNLVDSINQGHLEPQTRVFGTVIFTEAQHNRPLLFVHRIERLVDDVTHYQNGRNGQNGTKSTCTAPGAAATARVATFAAKHAIKLVEPLLQRFIEVWWPLIIAATTTTGSPGIIVVTVSTRFIP